MTGVTFALPDGSQLAVFDEEIPALADVLWSLSNLPGAVSCAGQLNHEKRRASAYRRPVALSEREGVALKRALAVLQTARSRGT